MTRVQLDGIDRPGLAPALAVRGLSIMPQPVSTIADMAESMLLTTTTDTGIDRLVSMRARWPGALAVLMNDGDEAALVRALDVGADEALPASASDALIAARLAALGRRLAWPQRIAVGPLLIDPVERKVWRGDRPIALLPREYRLLRYLADRPGRAASRAELLRAVWALDFDPGTNVVEVHISRLRARIDRGFAAPLLRTVKGRGYCLEAV